MSTPSQYHTVIITISDIVTQTPEAVVDEWGDTTVTSHRIQLAEDNPDNAASVDPSHGTMDFDEAKLLEASASPERYGAELARQLFASSAIVEHFLAAEAEAKGAMRLCLAIEPAVLQSLRWELLRHPRHADVSLGQSERVLLSRVMTSRDRRVVKPRAKPKLRALIAVAAPKGEVFAKLKLAPVEVEAEIAAARAALGELEPRVLGGPGDPVTLDRLVDELRDGVDILYLVCHGTFSRLSQQSTLILQAPDGDARSTKGALVASRVRSLQRVPMLVVLASCQSAGDGASSSPGDPPTALATIAGRLAEAGVPAVIAMQGYISMQTVAEMMPALFRELLRDGQIDRALAAARAVVQARADAWMPALYTRLKRGRLWYTEGFRSARGTELWEQLLRPIANGKIVPIIGPCLLETAHGSSHDIARSLAETKGYPFPLHEWDDLPRVAEFMGVTKSRNYVVETYKDRLRNELLVRHRERLGLPAEDKPALPKLFKKVSERLLADADDPHRILAELPASVYVTTNFDLLLELALLNGDEPRKPRYGCTPWRYGRKAFEHCKLGSFRPSRDNPLVYHVFGGFKSGDESLVITERDYFDYLVKANTSQLMPSAVQSALIDNSLLFLGFRLTDWHFRVMFQLLMSIPGRDRLKDYSHVAVQLDPDLETMADIEGARQYLAEYFGEANIDIYWGKSETFLCTLRDQLAAAGLRDAEPELEDEWSLGGEGEDEWELD